MISESFCIVWISLANCSKSASASAMFDFFKLPFFQFLRMRYNNISGKISIEYINLKMGVPNAGVTKLDACVTFWSINKKFMEFMTTIRLDL